MKGNILTSISGRQKIQVGIVLTLCLFIWGGIEVPGYSQVISYHPSNSGWQPPSSTPMQPYSSAYPAAGTSPQPGIGQIWTPAPEADIPQQLNSSLYQSALQNNYINGMQPLSQHLYAQPNPHLYQEPNPQLHPNYHPPLYVPVKDSGHARWLEHMQKPYPAPDQAIGWSGNIKLGIKNETERFEEADTALPNHYNQLHIALKYRWDKKNVLTFTDKLIFRRRNESVLDNRLALGWEYTPGKDRFFGISDTWRTIAYSDNTRRNFHDNQLEALWKTARGRFAFAHTLQAEKRWYTRFSNSDFFQGSIQSNTSYDIRNGSYNYDLKWDQRNYGNASFLNYSDLVFTSTFNRSYFGNNSEISCMEMVNARTYRSEAPALFRTDFIENLLTCCYELPLRGKTVLTLDEEYQQRSYPADTLQGYTLWKFKTAARGELFRDTRYRLSHQYINNGENVKARAYDNHIVTAVLDWKADSKFRFRGEDRVHLRDSKIGTLFNFTENFIDLRAIWSFAKKTELTWKTTYLTRDARGRFYPDYSIFTTGALIAYVKPRAFDWQVSLDYRHFQFQNMDTEDLLWEGKSRGKGEARGNFILNPNLKFEIRFAVDQTYLRSYDTLANEMIWDFTSPVIYTELSGGFNYRFD